MKAGDILLPKYIKEISKKINELISENFGIIDFKGEVIYFKNSLDDNLITILLNVFQQNKIDFIIADRYLCKRINLNDKIENNFLVFIYIKKNDDLEKYKEYINLICLNFETMKYRNDDKIDKSTFIKNLINSKYTQKEIFSLSKELHINSENKRSVFVIRVENELGNFVKEIVDSIFPNRSKDNSVLLSKSEVLLVKEIKKNSDLEKTSKILIDTVLTEIVTKIKIGIGSIVSFEDIKTSYNEAVTAIKISSIFEKDRDVSFYSKLGIGKLIYNLSKEKCEDFLGEIFGENDDFLDGETLSCVNKFFENNLNLSETSRQLFIHRNTLVYRIDKIQKNTGLDLRKFEDATTFKFALLISRYLDKFEKIV